MESLGLSLEDGGGWISHAGSLSLHLGTRQLGEFPHCRRDFVPDLKLRSFLHGQDHGSSAEIRVWSFKNGAEVDRGKDSEVTSGFLEHAVSVPLLPSYSDHLMEYKKVGI